MEAREFINNKGRECMSNSRNDKTDSDKYREQLEKKFMRKCKNELYFAEVRKAEICWFRSSYSHADCKDAADKLRNQLEKCEELSKAYKP